MLILLPEHVHFGFGLAFDCWVIGTDDNRAYNQSQTEVESVDYIYLAI